ncbi:hypothetical protein DFP72DRAFT_905074 [Ephemerocybe angulata]|uniref:Uncharacterized protein n=1 Tax=Ephemerocybe angulata TaxID=980116 RepID=A0A8H6HSW7_9AGAR|nr:hypothetical protein DFP72DRAFT_905074 [Tulosesus angulatus]
MENRKPFNGTTRRLLLAFDIGTTFSGISYSILDPGKIPEIRPVTRYPSQEHVGGDSKIPTVIYYDKRGNPVAIGAETLRDGIEADAEENGWQAARWFKLHLRPKSAVLPGDDPIPPLPFRKSIHEVFTDFLAYLHACAAAYITEAHGAHLWESISDNNVLYVLTHPNGWAGPQQTAMRRAASLAGLIPNTLEGGARVMFVTEGEASLHFCISNGLDLEDTDDDGSDGEEGRGVLIVDAGGGTVDVTSYCKGADGSFTEIAIPDCYFHGSAYVTMRAEKYFRNRLKGTRFERDVEILSSRFDRNTKHVFRREDESLYIQFASHRERDADLGIRGGRLTIEGKDVAPFFAPSVKCIVNAVKKQIASAHVPVKSVFLVGGFSASQWLFDQVRAQVEPLGVIVSRPDTHVNKAVSNGAVSFYLDSLVKSRIARATFGIDVMHTYDSTNKEHVRRGHLLKIHPVTGRPSLPNGFDVILPKDVEVAATEEFRRTYRTSAKRREDLKSHSVNLLSYNGDSDDPMWVSDEPDMYTVVCKVEADTEAITAVERTNPAGEIYYEIEFYVVLMFGLTELKAQIAYMEDGEQRRGPAAVVFSSGSSAFAGTGAAR